ncbi:MAG: cytochrome c [Rhodospirillaceae bacterium]
MGAACRIVGGFVALVWCVAAPGPGAALAPGTPDRLETLLLHDCGACHGGSLKGGLGRPLLPAALTGRTEETLATIILDGIPGTPMPPWRALLTPADAAWLARRLLKGSTP